MFRAIGLSDPLTVFSANSAMCNLTAHRGNSPGDYMVW